MSYSSPHLMSCISDTLRGTMAERPPSDLRLSVSWIKPVKESRKYKIWQAKTFLFFYSCKQRSSFTRRPQTAWSWIFLFVFLKVEQVGPQCRFALKDQTSFESGTPESDERVAVFIYTFSFLTCLTCSPWLQILSSRSQRLAIRVFSSTPVMLTSPWPSSTASRPIFSTSIRFVCMETDTLTQKKTTQVFG